MSWLQAEQRLNFCCLCVFFAGLWTEALSLTGEKGGKVIIQCSHANAFSNIKYFCKGACKYEDVLISSRKTEIVNTKYSIRDEGNTFYVTISDLRVDDSGTYWCGIERTGLDTYNNVVLTVTEGELAQCCIVFMVLTFLSHLQHHIVSCYI